MRQNEYEEIFWFNPIAHFNDHDVSKVAVDSNNIFGQKMIRSKSGSVIFTTTAKDTFRIEPLEELNKPWLFHNKTGVTAYISARTTESFLGKTDSILIISISNGKQIKLSKNYGFVYVHAFANLIQGNIHNLKLSAIADLRLGKFIFHDSILRDYKVGDEFIEITSGSQINGLHVSKQLTIIKSRSDYQDSVVYQYNSHNLDKNEKFNNGKFTVLLKKEAFINSDTFYVPSYGIARISSFEDRYQVNIGIGRLNEEKNYTISQKGSYYQFDGAFHYFFDNHNILLQEGYGKTSESYYIESFQVFVNSYIACFKGLDKNFGNCDSLTSVILSDYKPIGKKELKAGPNPATHLINVIGLTTNAIYKVYDIKGRLYLDGNVLPENAEIDTSSLDKGYYMLHITEADWVQVIPVTIN